MTMVPQSELDNVRPCTDELALHDQVVRIRYPTDNRGSAMLRNIVHINCESLRNNGAN